MEMNPSAPDIRCEMIPRKLKQVYFLCGVDDAADHGDKVERVPGLLEVILKIQQKSKLAKREKMVR